MAVIETWLEQDIKEPVQVKHLCGNFFSHNGNANRIGVKVFDNGSPVTLSGTVSGYAVLPDGTTVPCTGSLSGNQASVLLPAAAYVPGNICVTIMLTSGTTITTLGALTGTVVMARTDTQVDPGSVVTDWTNTINAALQTVEGYTGNIIATPYASLTFPVPLGKYCIYNNLLYRCVTPIATSENWTSSHWTQTKLADDVSDLKSAFDKYENLTNDGTYTIRSSDLEQGYWAYSTKNNTRTDRLRNIYLIPVKSGMKVKYSNPTMKVYFGVLQTPTSNTYLQTSGWISSGAVDAVYAINNDGYVTFMVEGSGTLTPLSYDSTVVITTEMLFASYTNKMYFSSGNISDITENSVYQVRTDDLSNIEGLPEEIACTIITNRFINTGDSYLTQLVITYEKGHVYYRRKYSSWGKWYRLSDFNNEGTYTGDLNNITDNVVRTVASGGTRPTNFPSAFGTDAAIIITVQLIPNNPNFLVQTCISYTTGRILTRYRNNTTWSAWNTPISLDNTMVVKGTLSSSGNADNITDNSVYGVQASNSYPSNYPMKTSPGILLTSKLYNVNGYGLQVAFPYDHGIMSDPYRYQNGLYARRLYNSTWQDWSFYKLTPRNHAGKYFAFGDSTTWGYSADRNHIQSPWNYPAIVGDLIGCEVHNLADPAQGLIKDWTSPATSGNFPIVDTIAEMVENGDFDGTTLVTVGWAYNDGSKYGALNFGSPTDPIPSSNTGITTFIGYYARILAVLQEAAPGAMVMLVTGYGTPWDNEGHKGDILFSYKYTFADGQKSTKEMYDALEQMANYYGFYCINQAKGGVINRVSANYIIGDNIHPTYDTYRIYGNFVASRIVSAFQNV